MLFEDESASSTVSEEDEWTTVKSKNGMKRATIVVGNESDESLLVGVRFLVKDVHLRKPFGSHEDGEEGIGKSGRNQRNQEWYGVDIVCIQRAKGACIVAFEMINSWTALIFRTGHR